MGERPIVWFSTNPYYEHTAAKLIKTPDGQSFQDMQHTHRVCGLVRFGVPPGIAPYSWPILKAKSRMSTRLARSMVRAAKKCGAKPSEWRGTFEPVPVSECIAIERFSGQGWEPYAK